MSMMQEVVRISDRFMSREDPYSIDRQGLLGNYIVLVLIFHLIAGIACVKMQELERIHPRLFTDLDVTFEFSAPPPEPTFRVVSASSQAGLATSRMANPGSQTALKPSRSDKVSLPAFKAPQVLSNPNPQPTHPLPSHRTTVAPPTAVTPTNLTSPAIAQLPNNSQPGITVPSLPATSTLPASGTPEERGTPDGVDGGVTGIDKGQGAGGTGVGSAGAGSGFGDNGGQILTKLPSSITQALGNIAPYRKDLLIRIAQNWHPKRKTENIIVLITLNNEGRLLASEIFESSGNKKADKEALMAVETVKYAPLPEWYKGKQLTFKIELSKVEAIQR